MPYELYGIRTARHGKTLWDILGNLKNHGVGRIVIRNEFSHRYPEPSWYRILKVEALSPEGKIQVCPPVVDMGEVRRVRALTDKVFRGKYHGQEWLAWTTYKKDFRLIPKDEEEEFTKVKTGELPEKFEDSRILPADSRFPPLLRELMIRDLQAKGNCNADEPKLPLVYSTASTFPQRVAKPGETPSLEITPGVGTPVAPRLYANIKKI